MAQRREGMYRKARKLVCTAASAVVRARTNFRGGHKLPGPISPVVRGSWKSYLCNVVMFLRAVYMAYMVEREYWGSFFFFFFFFFFREVCIVGHLVAVGGS